MNTGYSRKGNRQSSPHQGRLASSPRQAIPPTPVEIDSPRLGLKYAKGCAMNFDKIVKNSVNIDKFTMFFDKKLAREIIVKHCN